MIKQKKNVTLQQFSDSKQQQIFSIQRKAPQRQLKLPSLTQAKVIPQFSTKQLISNTTKVVFSTPQQIKQKFQQPLNQQIQNANNIKELIKSQSLLQQPTFSRRLDRIQELLKHPRTQLYKPVQENQDNTQSNTSNTIFSILEKKMNLVLNLNDIQQNIEIKDQQSQIFTQIPNRIINNNKFVLTQDNNIDKELMLQESEINPNLNMMAYQPNKQSYNLEKGLNFEIKSLNKHFQFNSQEDQCIPIMVSVKTLDSTNDQIEEQKENAKPLDSRPSIDLVCVIDNSGSMRNLKIKNVKSTLLQLLEMLNENDRISLILFNHTVEFLCNLRKVDAENKPQIQNIIKSIHTCGGTDIYGGMKKAFDVLENRQFSNPVTSIFLLSDGIDGCQTTDEKIKDVINSDTYSLKNQPFTIHSFGFGSNHDGPMMSRISDLKDGNFYYVENVNQVDEFFVDALGGLFSVVAQDIQIEINFNIIDNNFQKYFRNCQVSKTYGNKWECVKENENYKIHINQLFSGVSKDFIFEITIPKQEIIKLEDFERNIELIKGQLTAIPVDIQHTTRIVKESNLILTLFLQKETVPFDSEINDNVEFNYLRVKAAEAMEIAINLSEKNQFDLGKQVLQEMLGKIEKSHPINKEKLISLKKDITICQDSTNPKIYSKSGKFTLLSKKVATFTQTSKAIVEGDLYQNSIQKYLVQTQRAKKQC